MRVFCTLDHDKLDSRAYQSGWVDGQNSGIHLQPEFTKEFLKSFRKNPSTLVYELPTEQYEILREKFVTAQPRTKDL